MSPQTHYLGAFLTVDRRGYQRAVCGVAIHLREHSTQPTCPTCATWLADDDAGFASVANLGPCEHPVPVKPDSDPTRDLAERRR